MTRASIATLGLAVAVFTMDTSAWAQSAPIQSTPLPPLQRQWQQEGSSPIQQAPVSPGDIGQGGTGSGDIGQGGTGPGDIGQESTEPGGPAPDVHGQVPSTAPPAAVERPNIWVPAGVAKLQALDKVNAQASVLTIKVGQSATFGSLTITVKACVMRPADQPADAAAYLDVTDSHPDSPGFNGWMLEDEPSVSMMQHPIYDLRVSGCA